MKREPMDDTAMLLAAALLAEYRERGYSEFEACLLLLDVCARRAADARTAATSLDDKVKASRVEEAARDARAGLLPHLHAYEDLVKTLPAQSPSEIGISLGRVSGPPRRT